MKLYGLACSASPRVGGNTTAISLTGLSENLPAALEALEYQLRNVKPDHDILSELKADILRSREDSKKNQRATEWNVPGLSHPGISGSKQ